jgi:hypothetical protein
MVIRGDPVKSILLAFAMLAAACSDTLPAPSEYDSSADTGALDFGNLPIDGSTNDAFRDAANPPPLDFGQKDLRLDKGIKKSDSTIDQGQALDQAQVLPDSTMDLPAADSIPPDSTVDAGACTVPPQGAWTLDNQAMAVVGSSKVLNAAAGTGPDNVFIAGYGGDIWRRTGSGWSHYTTFPFSGTPSIYDMYINGKKLYVVGGASTKGAVGIYDGTNWTVKQTFAGTSNSLPKMKSISGVSSLEVYAVGGTVLLRYTGTDWQEYPSAGANMEAVAGMGGGVAFVGRGDEIYKFSKGAFATSAMVTPAIGDIRGIWSHAGYAISVGLSVPGGQSIIFYKPSSWAPDNAPSASLSAVFGNDSINDVYAVGSDSTILHFSGGAWTEPWETAVPAPKVQLQDVWIDKNGAVGYAVGTTSNVWKFTHCP